MVLVYPIHLKKPCPECGAMPNAPCFKRDGKPDYSVVLIKVNVHQGRVDAVMPMPLNP